MFKRSHTSELWGVLKQGAPPACASPPTVELRPNTDLSTQKTLWTVATTSYATYDADSHSWHTISNGERTKTNSPFSVFRGTIYEDTTEGLYALGKNDLPELIANATVRILAVKEIWSDEDIPKEVYVLEVQSAKWEAQRKTIEIPAEKYKTAYSILHRKFPDIFFSNADQVAVEAYLSDIFTRSQAGMQHIIETEYSGWLDLHGAVSYRIGRNAYYKEMKVPHIMSGTAQCIFQAGQDFLSVGKAQPPIVLLWMYAHLGFL